MELSTIQKDSITHVQIAELVGSRVDNVKSSIKKLASRGVVSFTASQETRVGSRSGEILTLNERDSYVVVAQLCPEFTAKLVDFWQAARVVSDPVLPQTLPEALRLAADLAEEKAALEQKVAEDAPKVEFVDSFVEFGGTKCISDVAKLIGIPQQRFFSLLRADSIVFKRSDGYRPYAAYEKYFDCKTGERNGHAYIQCRVNNDGIVYLSKRYGDLSDKPALSIVHSAQEA